MVSPRWVALQVLPIFFVAIGMRVYTVSKRLDPATSLLDPLIIQKIVNGQERERETVTSEAFSIMNQRVQIAFLFLSDGRESQQRAQLQTKASGH